MPQGPMRIMLVSALTVVCLSGCAWLTRSSMPRPGRQPSDLASPSISASGRFTLFAGEAQAYVDVPNAAYPQALVRDHVAGTTELVSSDTTGRHVVAVDGGVDLSADGRWIAFTTKDNETLGGTAGDTGFAIYTRSGAQRLDPPS